KNRRKSENRDLTPKPCKFCAVTADETALLSNLPDPDSAERDPAAVILEGDVTLRDPPVVRPLLELARVDALLPVRAAELVLHDLDSVQPVLDVVAVDHDPRGIPLADRAGDVLDRGIETVGRRRGRQGVLAVRVSSVVEQLVFRAGVIRLIAFFA